MQQTKFTITGSRDSNRPVYFVWVNGKRLSPKESQKIQNHSPDGFNWGYGGSGPAQTALAICLDIFKDTILAEALYQDFKWKFVAEWKEDDFSIQLDITQFLIDNQDKYMEALVIKGFKDSFNYQQ